MKSKERVKRAINFKGPDRIPVWSNLVEADFLGVGTTPSKCFRPLSEKKLKEKVPDFHGKLEQNEWGAIRGKLNKDGSSEPVAAAFAWDNFDQYEFPDLDKFYRYEEAASKIAANKNKYALPYFGVFYVSALYNLRTMENLFIDVGLNSDKIQQFCKRLEPFQHKRLELWSKAGADGILFGEDLGLQDRLMIKPDTWRELFKPYYKRFVEYGHDLGLDIMMHSCGYIEDIIPDLIEIGINVLQFDQPEIYGISRLSQKFGGKICFFCPVDIQNVMPSGDKKEIQKSALKMCDELGKFNGGFMGKDYPQWDMIGISEECAAWAREVFLEYTY